MDSAIFSATATGWPALAASTTEFESERPLMAAETSKRATGYPPVTKIEEETAARSASAAPSSGASRLDADGKLIVDAIAAVFDRHRNRVSALSMDPEEKRCVLDLLDAVFLDLLQVVLNEASAVEQVLQRHERHRAAS